MLTLAISGNDSQSSSLRWSLSLNIELDGLARRGQQVLGFALVSFPKPGVALHAFWDPNSGSRVAWQPFHSRSYLLSLI